MSERSHESVELTKEAIDKWLWQYGSDPSDVDIRIERDDDDCIWVRLDLTSTRMRGWSFDPFVLDLSQGHWLQGWSNGDVLTFCTPSRHAEFAARYFQLRVAGVAPADGPSSSPEHPER